MSHDRLPTRMHAVSGLSLGAPKITCTIDKGAFVFSTLHEQRAEHRRVESFECRFSLYSTSNLRETMRCDLNYRFVDIFQVHLFILMGTFAYHLSPRDRPHHALGEFARIVP